MTGDYSNITKLIINGYDCIAGKLIESKNDPDNCLSVAAVRNADGSYTVTITGVTNEIIADIAAHKVVVGDLAVPTAFTDIEELDSVEKIQAKLETKLTASLDGKVFYDIALKYKDGSKSQKPTSRPTAWMWCCLTAPGPGCRSAGPRDELRHGREF